MSLTSPNDFVIKVQTPRNLLIMKPPKSVLISGMPLCFAYIAYSLTKTAAEIANNVCHTPTH